MVLGTAVLLVFGIARALGAGTDASSQPEAQQQQARQVAAAPSTTLALPGESPTATESARGRSERKKQVVPLAVPDGPCEDEDLSLIHI